MCDELFEYSKERPIPTAVVSDKEAIAACIKFAGRLLSVW